MDEDGSNKIICRLCLEITPASECVTIEQIKKEILEVLPINLNFDISDYAVVCNKCLESLEHCFDFKSQCNTIYLDADTKVDIKNVSENETVSDVNTYFENFQVCQLCMSIIKDKDLNYITNLKDGFLLEDIIRNCLPELGSNSAHEPLICNQCLNGITRYYEFVKNCQQVELRIEHFCQVTGHDIASRVNLKDMLKFKDCEEFGKPLIKKESSKVENIDMNVTKCLKNEEIARIQCDEIDIKEELDNGVEFSKFDQPDDYDTSGKSSKGKEKIKKSESRGKLHFCPKCPYSSNCSSNMTKHIRCHRDNEVRKCTLCSFVTDARLSLRAHIVESHSGLTKTYGCRECPYETDQKRYLERHGLTHKGKWEVELYKCALCPFQSKYKSTVRRHHKIQHDKNVEFHKCKKCSFSSKHKTNLRLHQTVHENPDEIRKYKCETCGYLFKRSADVKKHMVVHTGKHMFSCNKCTYSTTYRGDLRMHKHEHHKDGKRKMDECEDKAMKYSYEAIVQHQLCQHLRIQHSSGTLENRHMPNHSSVQQEAISQCDQCNFWIKHKAYPPAHTCFQNYTKQSAVECFRCKYPTRNKPNLNEDRVTHVGVEKAMLYYCATCNFETKYKCSLRDHIKRCLKRTKENNQKIV